MPTEYPEGRDVFIEPTLPEETPLSQAGSGDRNHTQHHRDLGDAIEAIEENAALKSHDHDGTDDVAHGPKLAQVNTHENVDTDKAVTSYHHTLGTGAFQAAAGNHIHSYNQLTDRPYIVCTTTTRPTNPFIGMQIYETDTNTVRVWATFPTNPDATGIITFDDFNRDYLDHDDDHTYWHIVYGWPVGRGFYKIWKYTDPDDLEEYLEELGDRYHHWVHWWKEYTEHNWVRLRRIKEDDCRTESDDQECEVDWGDFDFEDHNEHDDNHGPCNDHYFRMSEDQNHYCRVAFHYGWAVIYASHGGHDGEIVLGRISIPVWEPRIRWKIRWIDWECHIWRNGIFCGSIVDHNHYHYRGPLYRWWGFGCHVRGHPLGQWRPPDVLRCEVKDVVSYTPATRWGLLPVASVPVLIAEAGATQEIRRDVDEIVVWGFIVLEWVHRHFFQSSDTEVVISEPGVYHVHVSVCWDPQRTWHDHSMIAVKLNGHHIKRKNWEFIRGYSYVPGFAQTNEINFWWRFNAGDRLQVVARHNGRYNSWLWHHLIDPDAQVSHLELVYHTP